MRALRKTAATVRREAIGDMSNDERDRFVDTLIKIKSNLLNFDPDGKIKEEYFDFDDNWFFTSLFIRKFFKK